MVARRRPVRRYSREDRLLEPENQTVAFGDPVTLTVQAASNNTPLLRYQWLLDGVPIPGASGATHEIPAFQSQHVGNYSVVISNVAGSATSATATIETLPSTDVVLQVALVNGQLLLSWPASDEGFAPHETGSLTPPIQWSPVDGEITQQNDANSVTITLPSETRFFRLVQ
jgi:hypothetical protein